MTKTPEKLPESWENLDWYNFYYCKNNIGRVVIAMKTGEHKLYSREYDGNLTPDYWKIIGKVPTYDEYWAMQAELDEFKRTVTSYIGKPINYDIACETVNKLLDDKKKLKKELESARWYQTVQNEDIGKLRDLLKGCLPIVSAEIMTWQIRGGEEAHKRGQDLLTSINVALDDNKIQANPVDNIKKQEREVKMENLRFKFRVWDDEKKQYHYNDFVVTATGYIAKVEVNTLEQTFIDQTDFNFDNMILEQCTGLRDKNGKLIYEGDIIGNKKYVHEIVWSNKDASFHTKLKGMEFIGGHLEQSWIDTFGFEIIGNVHENIELLNV